MLGKPLGWKLGQNPLLAAVYIDMVTVTKTADNDQAQYFALPGGLGGTVHVRARDADRTSGRTQLDTLHVDELLIVSEESTVAPGAATVPTPAHGATNVAVGTDLAWTAGELSASHNVFFGTSSTNPAFQGNQTGTTFDPGTLLNSTISYWAVEEVNGSGTTPGPVWSFATAPAPLPLPGLAVNPNPAPGALNVSRTPTLSWTAGSYAASHNVYFGTTPGNLTFRGNRTGATFAPGSLGSKVKYYWRIDEVNSSGVTTGTEWSFTTRK